MPEGVAYDSSKGEIFVANSGDNTVSVISDSSNAVNATIPVGLTPDSVAYDSGRGEIFVTNSKSNLYDIASYTVSVISDSSDTVVATIPVGNTPQGVSYDSGKSEIFVANSNSGSVSVINDASLSSPSSSPTASTTPTASPSPVPTAPEFSAAGFFLVTIAVVAVSLCVVAWAAKNDRIQNSQKERKH